MKIFMTAVKIFLLFTLLTGFAYPLLITGIAQLFFREKANGNIIFRNNQKIGSTLIGQQFDSSLYFFSRPSAVDYNPLPSGGSNYALTNSKLKKLVNDRRKNFISANQLDSLSNIPAEMLFTSASGLDPHITPGAAILQINRIVKARHFTARQRSELIKQLELHTENPQFLCLGEKRINVLLLNLELDKIR
jgi:potassium-transporting ATPase KdpC subunit